MNRQEEIVRLTKAAAEAAERGKWDVVIQCCHDRGVLLQTARAPVRGSDDLLKLDGRIRDRVTTAQAALASLLDEAAETRRRLQGLRRRLGELPQTPASVSVEA